MAGQTVRLPNFSGWALFTTFLKRFGKYEEVVVKLREGRPIVGKSCRRAVVRDSGVGRHSPRGSHLVVAVVLQVTTLDSHTVGTRAGDDTTADTRTPRHAILSVLTAVPVVVVVHRQVVLLCHKGKASTSHETTASDIYGEGGTLRRVTGGGVPASDGEARVYTGTVPEGLVPDKVVHGPLKVYTPLILSLVSSC